MQKNLIFILTTDYIKQLFKALLDKQDNGVNEAIPSNNRDTFVIHAVLLWDYYKKDNQQINYYVSVSSSKVETFLRDIFNDNQNYYISLEILPNLGGCYQATINNIKFYCFYDRAAFVNYIFKTLPILNNNKYFIISGELEEKKSEDTGERIQVINNYSALNKRTEQLYDNIRQTDYYFFYKVLRTLSFYPNLNFNENNDEIKQQIKFLIYNNIENYFDEINPNKNRNAYDIFNYLQFYPCKGEIRPYLLMSNIYCPKKEKIKITPYYEKNNGIRYYIYDNNDKIDFHQTSENFSSIIIENDELSIKMILIEGTNYNIEEGNSLEHLESLSVTNINNIDIAIRGGCLLNNTFYNNLSIEIHLRDDNPYTSKETQINIKSNNKILKKGSNNNLPSEDYKEVLELVIMGIANPQNIGAVDPPIIFTGGEVLYKHTDLYDEGGNIMTDGEKTNEDYYYSNLVKQMFRPVRMDQTNRYINFDASTYSTDKEISSFLNNSSNNSGTLQFENEHINNSNTFFGYSFLDKGDTKIEKLKVYLEENGGTDYSYIEYGDKIYSKIYNNKVPDAIATTLSTETNISIDNFYNLQNNTIGIKVPNNSKINYSFYEKNATIYWNNILNYSILEFSELYNALINQQTTPTN